MSTLPTAITEDVAATDGTVEAGHVNEPRAHSNAAVAWLAAQGTRTLLFDDSTGWPARPDDDVHTRFVGGDVATDAPDDPNLRALDEWVPAEDTS